MARPSSLFQKWLWRISLSPAALWICVFIGVLIFFHYGNWTTSLLPQSLFVSSLGLIGILGGLILLVGASFYSVSVPRGIYASIRHPRFSAYILIAGGIFFFYPSLVVFLCAVWAITLFILQAYLEELFFLKQGGKRYRVYRRTTGMFLARFSDKGKA